MNMDLLNAVQPNLQGLQGLHRAKLTPMVYAHSAQTKKFVLHGAHGGPSEKVPIIERLSFIIKLAS